MRGEVAAEVVRGHALGFRSLGGEGALDDLPVQGAVPSWLHGTYLRNGPALFEAGKTVVSHWFDGLAALQRFHVAEGRVSFAARHLRTLAYEAAESGRVPAAGFATRPRSGLLDRLFAPRADNANGSVERFGAHFAALGQNASSVSFEPRTLETRGTFRFEDRVPDRLTTEHPVRDPDTRALLNVTTRTGRRPAYVLHRMPEGKLARHALATVPVKHPAYLHSFAVTERHVVLVEPPLLASGRDLDDPRRPLAESYAWTPERGTRFLVLDKDSGRLLHERHGPPLFLLHHVRAFEDRNGDIVLDLVAHDGPDVLASLDLPALRGGAPAPFAGRLWRCRVRPDHDFVESSRLREEPIELPCVAPDVEGEHLHVYGVGLHPSGARDFPDQLVKLDPSGGPARVWHAPGTYPGEPCFVRRPGSVAEDDGVLLSVALDARRGRSALLVLDATTMRLLARAELPHALPFGMHGRFFRAA